MFEHWKAMSALGKTQMKDPEEDSIWKFSKQEWENFSSIIFHPF